MKLKVDVNTATGAAYIAAIDPSTGEHRKATTVDQGQEVELDFPNVHDVSEVEFGDVVETENSNPAQPEDAESPQNEAGAASDTPEGDSADQAGTEPQNGEPATTSAASELPLYLIDALIDGNIPKGYSLSGLETPDGKTLYHCDDDEKEVEATGRGDGITVYADADDNEQPVCPAEASEEGAAA